MMFGVKSPKVNTFLLDLREYSIFVRLQENKKLKIFWILRDVIVDKKFFLFIKRQAHIATQIFVININIAYYWWKIVFFLHSVRGLGTETIIIDHVPYKNSYSLLHTITNFSENFHFLIIL